MVLVLLYINSLPTRFGNIHFKRSYFISSFLCFFSLKYPHLVKKDDGFSVSNVFKVVCHLNSFDIFVSVAVLQPSFQQSRYPKRCIYGYRFLRITRMIDFEIKLQVRTNIRRTLSFSLCSFGWFVLDLKVHAPPGQLLINCARDQAGKGGILIVYLTTRTTRS